MRCLIWSVCIAFLKKQQRCLAVYVLFGVCRATSLGKGGMSDGAAAAPPGNRLREVSPLTQ